MRKLLKSFKTEINPTAEQKNKINRTIGVCRFVYNFYLAHNREIFEQENRFVSGYDFSIWLNNDFIPDNPEFVWIKEVSSKSVRKWKKKNNSDVKMYFVRTDKKAMIYSERHRIKIPTLGWVRLKEKGYIPTSKDGYIIKSGTVSCKAGRYYVSVLIEVPENEKSVLNDFGIGIDLGVKNFAVCSDGKIYKNINKSSRIQKK